MDTLERKVWENMKNIIVFNNTTGIAEIMAPFFNGEDVKVQTAQDFEEVLQLIGRENVHLLLIDAEWDEKGWSKDMEAIRYLRQQTAAPIIVVSSQAAELAKVMALTLGADDYVMADDNPLVILARIKAQLRQYTQLLNSNKNISSVYRVGNLEMDDLKHRVTVNGRDVKMTPIEYKILRLLIQQRGKVISIDQIYEAIWKMKAIGADNTVTVHIRHIREKIENNPKRPCYLKVVRGMGYKVV